MVFQIRNLIKTALSSCKTLKRLYVFSLLQFISSAAFILHGNFLLPSWKSLRLYDGPMAVILLFFSAYLGFRTKNIHRIQPSCDLIQPSDPDRITETFARLRSKIRTRHFKPLPSWLAVARTATSVRQSTFCRWISVDARTEIVIDECSCHSSDTGCRLSMTGRQLPLSTREDEEYGSCAGLTRLRRAVKTGDWNRIRSRRRMTKIFRRQYGGELDSIQFNFRFPAYYPTFRLVYGFCM